MIEMKISKAGTVPNFRVLAQANASRTPIAPVKTVIYGIGGGVGVALCIFLVIIRYLLQNRVNSLREVGRLARAPILGIVPKYEKKAMEYSQLVVNIQTQPLSLTNSFFLILDLWPEIFEAEQEEPDWFR